MGMKQLILTLLQDWINEDVVLPKYCCLKGQSLKFSLVLIRWFLLYQKGVLKEIKVIIVGLSKSVEYTRQTKQLV